MGITPVAPRPISAADDIAAFECGEPDLTLFLQRRALANEGLASRTFVLAASSDSPGTIAGYYSLLAGSIHRGDLPGKYRRNMPDPVPVIMLGRLAVDRRHERRGVGTLLLRDAIKRYLAASQLVGVRLLLVQPISPEAGRFYAQYGFRPISASSPTLGLPTESLAATL